MEVKDIAGSTTGYTLPPGKCEISDIIIMLKSLLPGKVEVNITNDDIRLKAILTNTKTLRFTKKSFLYAILGFTQPHSGPLGDFKNFVHIIPGTYKSEKPINITGIDKISLKADCVDGSIVNDVREHILYSFTLDKPPGRKIYK